jgi:selenocysteine lyase/cysteine desulfurase
MAGGDPVAGLASRTRSDFAIAREWAFLDNAYIPPLPRAVKEAALEWYERRASEQIDVFDLLRTVSEVRQSFSRFINASPEEIGFLYTTSEAENIVTRALELVPGDNIVTDDLAYPHTLVLGRQLEKTAGIEFRVVRHNRGTVTADDFAALVDRRTRLITIPWVSNINALRHPVAALADLAHTYGAWLLVDAIQIVGTEPLDVRAAGIDVLCTGTYKWLMAGWGIAALYVRREILDRLPPDRYGWQTALASVSSPQREDPRRTAAKFEYASPSFDQYPILQAALCYKLGLGLDAVHRHSQAWLGRARRYLEGAGFELLTPPGNVAPALTFWVGASREETDGRFRAANVRVGFSTGSRTSETYGADPSVCRVRVSPAHYNDWTDLERFLGVACTLPRYRTEAQ